MTEKLGSPFGGAGERSETERVNVKKRKTWKKWILASLIILAIFGLLLACGFRITYSPSLESNWEAIGAVAGWISAISTTAAVVAAVAIARKQNTIAEKQREIAEYQNRISLFEKRFEYYRAIQRCISFGEIAKLFKSSEATRLLFIASFKSKGVVELFKTSDDEEYKKAISIELYDMLFRTVQEGEFLFDFETEEILLPIIKTISIIIHETLTEEEFETLTEELAKSSEIAGAELLPKIRKVLRQTK